MTKKTGKVAVKARQQMRAAKMAKQKRELAEAGVKLGLPKPSAEARRQKEEELKRLYLELFPKKKAEAEGEKAEQPAEGEQQEQPTERQEQAEEQRQGEQEMEAERQEQVDEPQEKQEAQSD